MKTQEIRKMWLSFFESKGHHIEQSASLIPNNDPTLLWINAGVAALKKYFDGREIPNNKRIVNIQKSLRTNDIENVGKTARHHTMFEMMGNFSIGDYFRKEAIEYGFELLTSDKWFDIPKEKLYITYYPDDKETLDKWISLGIDPTHMIPSKDNFWEIGEGPCGPDTEIYFDRGEKYDPNHLGVKMISEDIENDRYIEIWNIVLSQFNAKEGVERKNYKELPNKNIDTGAGIERFACILQGVDTNFDTDLFTPIINSISKLTNIKYNENKTSYRIIADHVKACTFTLSDGAQFSNEGRGYVLRRLLRRGVSHGHKLGINEPFMYTLVKDVIDVYSCFYPELIKNKELVENLIKSEEIRFFKTLTKGEEVLKEMAKKHNIDGFKLHDTFGFPIELSIELANELGEKIDLNDFKKKMDEQKKRARAAIIGLQSMQSQSKDLLDCNLKSTFSYDTNDLNAKVIAIFKDGNFVNEIDDTGEVIFDITNFYAEMGGQIADNGKIYNKTTEAEVNNVLNSPHKQHLHFVKVLFGNIKVGDTFTLSLNMNKRNLTMRNHTATHLLDATLSKVFGPQVEQKGSLVTDQYLRFDFNYGNKIDNLTLKKIEDMVNEQIFKGLDVTVSNLPIEEAKKLGAKMVFTEKYGDIVRVIKVSDYSLEFCGGTHVKNTNEIGIFKIESEESIAAGIRRITAKTSKGAYDLIKEKENVLNTIMNLVNAKNINEIPLAVSTINKEKDLLKLNLKKCLSSLANNIASNLKSKFESVNNKSVLIEKIEGANRDLLLNIASNLKTNNKNYLIILFGIISNEEIYLYVCSDIKEIHSGNIVKAISNVLGGSGGGKPSEANGKIKSFTNISGIKEIVNKII